MFRTCDVCAKKFDIFQEGNAHQFYVVCGLCWAVEMKCREIGGVFSNDDIAQMRQELATQEAN